MVAFTGVASISAGACSDDADDGPRPELTDSRIQAVIDVETLPNYAAPTLPAHFQDADVTAIYNEDGDNSITDEGALLGRVLFYEPMLSLNESTACADCHQQDAGFSDNDTLSTGFEGALTGRNSMSLINVAYYPNEAMFWDERAETLEHQVLMPIQDPGEMGMTLDALVERLAATEHYPVLFHYVFGDDEVSSERISLALSQFVRSIVSTGSKYDNGIAMINDVIMNFPNFTAQENEGKSLFFTPPMQGPSANCAVCHTNATGRPAPGAFAPAIFQIDNARHNGMPIDDDLGVGGANGRAGDEGKFKSSSLRNIALTAPYMHDGSFATLRDVIDHYDSGIVDHPNLDNTLQPGGVVQDLGLTENQKDALEAFLHTLTDDDVTNDAKFADPFR